MCFACLPQWRQRPVLQQIIVRPTAATYRPCWWKLVQYREIQYAWEKEPWNSTSLSAAISNTTSSQSISSVYTHHSTPLLSRQAHQLYATSTRVAPSAPIDDYQHTVLVLGASRAHVGTVFAFLSCWKATEAKPPSLGYSSIEGPLPRG